MLHDIKSTLAICSPNNTHRFADLVDTVISIDGEFIRSLPASLTRISSSTTSKSAAYVIFTSGTIFKTPYPLPHRRSRAGMKSLHALIRLQMENLNGRNIVPCLNILNRQLLTNNRFDGSTQGRCD